MFETNENGEFRSFQGRHRSGGEQKPGKTFGMNVGGKENGIGEEESGNSRGEEE